jgi:very-short-patch-repair endonuclease
MSIENARKLRKSMTDAERAMWRLLRDRRLSGWRFRRQEPIDRYVVDFICFEARLVLEIDGGQHFESEADKRRDAYLQAQGLRVLRFWNNDVLSNREGVQRIILEALTRCAPDGAAPLIQLRLSSRRSLRLRILPPQGGKGIALKDCRITASEPACRPSSRRSRGRSCGRASRLRRISPAAGTGGICCRPGLRRAPA